MLTSRGSREDIVRWLDYGADDYLSKPCDYRELISRVRALGRRSHANKSTERISYGELIIDTRTMHISWGSCDIELSRREYELLLYFAKNNNRIISKSELWEKIWWIYDSWTDMKVVDVYIGYLRKKINPDIIETRKGFGYIFYNGKKHVTEI